MAEIVVPWAAGWGGVTWTIREQSAEQFAWCELEAEPEGATESMPWAEAGLTCPACGWTSRHVFHTGTAELTCHVCGESSEAPHLEDLEPVE